MACRRAFDMGTGGLGFVEKDDMFSFHDLLHFPSGLHTKMGRTEKC